MPVLTLLNWGGGSGDRYSIPQKKPRPACISAASAVFGGVFGLVAVSLGDGAQSNRFEDNHGIHMVDRDDLRLA